ncbi:MarR family winged helix-turn-helix transcriptional regulator [Dyadobacter frigoris]|uniref:MarR family winged helix-turn-helix transcriptional regulator n=1 Tax=Dyadobacter frigoris TaxID=2576211 RepID=UPI001C708CA2|nr:MarR family transcriptional regulator [Dyadobacter frigoris]
MSAINESLTILMNLAKVQSIVSRRFDRLNMHGIGFTDFMILYFLNQSAGQSMRRIDLAEKAGITASGITRTLLPLEKIGLVGRETNGRDARVSYVILTEAGKQLFNNASGTANALATEIISAENAANNGMLFELLTQLGGNIN